MSDEVAVSENKVYKINYTLLLQVLRGGAFSLCIEANSRTTFEVIYISQIMGIYLHFLPSLKIN